MVLRNQPTGQTLIGKDLMGERLYEVFLMLEDILRLLFLPSFSLPLSHPLHLSLSLSLSLCLCLSVCLSLSLCLSVSLCLSLSLSLSLSLCLSLCLSLLSVSVFLSLSFSPSLLWNIFLNKQPVFASSPVCLNCSLSVTPKRGLDRVYTMGLNGLPQNKKHKLFWRGQTSKYCRAHG